MAKKRPGWSIWKNINGSYSAYKPSNLENWQEVNPADCEFVAALKLTEFYHGRRTHFYFKDIQTNMRYLVQGTEMKKILFNHTLEKGFVCGRWGWIKRHDTLSIELLEELEDVQSPPEPIDINSSIENSEKLT